jgi:hypothetical protein
MLLGSKTQTAAEHRFPRDTVCAARTIGLVLVARLCHMNL